MKTANSKIYIELLEVFRIGLIKGLIEKEEVIKWADSVIQQEEQPDHFVLELSLCGHKSINDVVSLINEFVGETKPTVSGRVILGFAYRQYSKKVIALREVISAIYWLTWEGNLTEKEKLLMYGLDDDLDCAESGIFGSVDGVEKEALRFLEIYKDYSIDNYHKWKGIDNTIDEKVDVLSKIVTSEHLALMKARTKKNASKWWEFWKN